MAISIEEAKAKFLEVVSPLEWWQRFIGSQYVEGLSRFQALALRRALVAVERAKQENFLRRAINETSILAHGEDRNYVPRKLSPSKGQALATNVSDVSIDLLVGQEFQSAEGLVYTLDSTVSVPAGGTALLNVTQWQARVFEFEITESLPFGELALDQDSTRQTARLDVYVDQGAGYEKWGRTSRFIQAEPTSQAYVEFYTPARQLGVRFGNGRFGVQPVANSKVQLKAWLTGGVTELIAGQALDLISDDQVLLDAVTVKTQVSIVGGAPGEGIEEHRNNAGYYVLYDDKLVWDDDYVFFLGQHIPGISWIRVWGEEEEEAVNGASIANINKIFFSLHVPGRDDTEVRDEALALFEGLKIYNRPFEGRVPVLRAFSVSVSAKIARTLSKADVTAEVRRLLDEKYGLSAVKRPAKILLKDIYALLNATGYFNPEADDYSVQLSGVTAPEQLNDLIYLDLDASTITVDYE